MTLDLRWPDRVKPKGNLKCGAVELSDFRKGEGDFARDCTKSLVAL
jgi:hypothetical protein